ncbi:MAG: hypothetical protein HRT83_07405, partial [Hyphomicrobiaceae bacterium]|nr:hypothetical protein [Hyphomicrobiaceae bacterium]
MSKTLMAFTVIFVTFVQVSAVSAQSTKIIKRFQDWVLYSHKGAPATICFISARPREKKPNKFSKKESYFYISAWPDNGVKAEVSVNIRNELQNGSTVTAQIGGARYRLFTKGNKAFVEKPSEEIKLIEAMKRGSFMVVRATSRDGIKIVETYSLLGVTSAINSLRKGC